MSPYGARNQEWLCWREPASIYWTGYFSNRIYWLEKIPGEAIYVGHNIDISWQL
jgi:hypothetical protein